MGHEISGANSYFRCAIPGLHLALQALIDYKGNNHWSCSFSLRNFDTIFLHRHCHATDHPLTLYGDDMTLSLLTRP